MASCVIPGCDEPRKAGSNRCREHYNEQHREWTGRNRERVKDANLKQRYGLSLEEYEELLDEQEGVCAICKQPERDRHYKTGVPKHLAVDHDHDTDVVRGLLCGRCNNLREDADDDPVLLYAAIEYLRALENSAAPLVNRRQAKAVASRYPRKPGK